MAQEENNILGCSSYSGGGVGSGCSGGVSSSSRSKKIKQKKVPQRGLGVAQLEKIRLEEQQKKQSLQAANILAKNAICSPKNNNTISPPFLAAQCSNFRPPFHNSAPLPPPPPPPPPSSSPPSTTNLPSPKPLYNSVRKTINGDNWHRLWNGVDNRGFPFDPQVNIPFDPSVVMPPPIMPSSMVNPTSIISLSSPMEPPSNQNFRGNNYVSSWTDEDKMVGMKRSYPFSLESPPLQCNFRPKYDDPVSKSDELASSSNGCTRNKCMIRDNVKEVNRENERLNGDFLTLAPPNLNSKHELFEYESTPSQEYAKSPESFSFFPIKLQTNETTRHLSNGNNDNNGEKGEPIDLNLKL